MSSSNAGASGVTGSRSWPQADDTPVQLVYLREHLEEHPADVALVSVLSISAVSELMPRRRARSPGGCTTDRRAHERKADRWRRRWCRATRCGAPRSAQPAPGRVTGRGSVRRQQGCVSGSTEVAGTTRPAIAAGQDRRRPGRSSPRETDAGRAAWCRGRGHRGHPSFSQSLGHASAGEASLAAGCGTNSEPVR